MAEKKAQEHTFLENGKIYYNMISEDRIREIIREEIVEYNEIFMSQSHQISPDEKEGVEEVNTESLQNEENWEDEADVRMIYNDAQMLNGTFEGDTISQKGKRIKLKQSKKGLNTDPGNPDSGE